MSEFYSNFTKYIKIHTKLHTNRVDKVIKGYISLQLQPLEFSTDLLQQLRISTQKAHRNAGDAALALKYLAKAHMPIYMHLFLTPFMNQAKAPAGETHSSLYSLRTRDCGEKGEEKGRRVWQEGGAQVETLVHMEVQHTVYIVQKKK